MEYFYVFLPHGLQQKNVLESITIPKERIFVDYENDEINWFKLMHDIKKKDSIIIPSIEMLSSEEIKIKRKLEMVRDLELQLFNMDKKQIDYVLLLDFMEFLNKSKKKKAKELQRIGIERALEKKQRGEGSFGRPRIKPPDDFEFNLDRVFEKEITHEFYRNKLGMKRSTYYKLVHAYKIRLEQKM